ncbi:MAG: VCBS repeat-containing protein [Cyanobacteria bacterium P01_F01_bin.33]
MLSGCSSVIYTSASDFDPIQLSSEEYIPPIHIADFLVDGYSLILLLIEKYPPYKIANNRSIDIADIDGDYDLDIISVNKDGYLIIARNQEHRSFEVSKSHPVIGNNIDSVTLSDLNEDRNLDIVAISEGENKKTISVLLGDKDILFHKPISFGVKIEQSLLHIPYVVVDLNYDAIDDFIALGTTNLSLRFGRKDGSYSRPILTEHNMSRRYQNSKQFSTGDLNRDSLPDLIIPYGKLFDITLRGNDTNGKFTRSESLCIGYDSNSILVDDFNADGNNDLIVAQEASGKVSIIDSKDILSGTNQPLKSIRSILRNARLIQLEDMDSDGYLDLISVSPFNDEVSISYGPLEIANLDEVRIGLMTESGNQRFRFDGNAILAQVVNRPIEFLNDFLVFLFTLIHSLFYSISSVLSDNGHKFMPPDRSCDWTYSLAADQE